MGIGQRDWLPSIPENQDTVTDQSAPSDPISFLKAIPDGRYRIGVPNQWFLLLVTALEILSGCRSSRDLKRFARRHWEAMNQALGGGQALALGCHLPLPLQQGPPAGVWAGATGL